MHLKMMILGLLLLCVAAGCQTDSGIHTIPLTRDYARLDKVTIDDAAQSLREAHQRGAESAAPYQYASALHYLAIAREQARVGDRPAARDYAGLSKQFSEAALRLCSAPEPAQEPSASYDATLARFETAKTRYAGLDAHKAADCAPTVYAHLTATLSRAEHALKYRPGWRRADQMLALVDADLDAIRRQDLDADGVADLDDAEPRMAEDFDAFQDTDGAPDPDNDRDRVPDKTDLQPLDAETANGYKDHDGAPDELPTLRPISFTPGSSDLSGEAKGYLQGVAALLGEWPRLRLRIAGHANPGVESRAIDLSRLRAENVTRYLVEQGASDTQLVATFHGAAQPKGQNARVELQFE